MTAHVNEYETIFVARPDLPEEEVIRIRTKLEGILAAGAAEVLEFDDWGRRKLAYIIEKHNHGHYHYLNYVSPAALPLELERNLRNEDNLIRFLTVRLGEDVDLEACRVAATERIRLKALRAAEQASDDYAEDSDDEDSSED